jgi:hypothetical protein
MSEQKSNFMAALDQWSEANVVEPLLDNEDEVTLEDTIAGVKKAIRTKVLESYHNGQAAKATPPARRQGGRYGR